MTLLRTAPNWREIYKSLRIRNHPDKFKATGEEEKYTAISCELSKIFDDRVTQECENEEASQTERFKDLGVCEGLVDVATEDVVDSMFKEVLGMVCERMVKKRKADMRKKKREDAVRKKKAASSTSSSNVVTSLVPPSPAETMVEPPAPSAFSMFSISDPVTLHPKSPTVAAETLPIQSCQRRKSSRAHKVNRKCDFEYNDRAQRGARRAQTRFECTTGGGVCS